MENGLDIGYSYDVTISKLGLKVAEVLMRFHLPIHFYGVLIRTETREEELFLALSIKLKTTDYNVYSSQI